MIKSIGEDWKEIENSGKGNNQEEEEQKQLQKKKKLRKKNQELGSRQKMMMMRWVIQQTYTMSCKRISWDKET